MDSLLFKRNKQNHLVCRLHYSADPAKDPTTIEGKKWVDFMASKYLGGKNSLLWRGEMEIDFSAGRGELVFPEFAEMEEQLIVAPFDLPKGTRYYGGLDWGIRNPVSFHVYAQTPDNDFYSVWEYYRKGNETNVFDVSQVITRDCPFYRKLEWIAYDPQMNKEDQQRKDGLTSIIRMFQEEVPAENQIDKLMTAHDRNDMLAVSIFQQLFVQKKFRFFNDCVNQISEFRNLKYPPKIEGKNEPEKLLDKDNHCYSSDTEILTDTGWKYFSQLGINDLVATQKEGSLAFEKPKEILSYDYSGEMREYKTSAINFCVTPNHKMWVADQVSVVRHKSPVFRRVCVDELPEVSWVSKTCSYDVPEINVPDTIIAWYGFWLAEGCKSQNYKGSYYAHIDQSLKKIDRELVRMLRSAGHYSRRYTPGGMVRFSFGKKFYDLVKENGRAHTKFIPMWLKAASPRQLRLLIKWMIRGDGTFNKKMWRYNTCSQKLADDFQEVCVKAGYSANFSEEKSHVSVLPSGRAVVSKLIYHINLRRGKSGQGGAGFKSLLTQIHKHNIRSINYVGKVFCVNTSSGVVYVRRNGKGMWCGQSWDDAKYFLLSHPSAQIMKRPMQYGTREYMEKVTEMSEAISQETGQSVQEIFSDLYGREIE